MANNEHPNQDKYESVELTINQWKQVVEKAKTIFTILSGYGKTLKISSNKRCFGLEFCHVPCYKI